MWLMKCKIIKTINIHIKLIVKRKQRLFSVRLTCMIPLHNAAKFMFYFTIYWRKREWENVDMTFIYEYLWVEMLYFIKEKYNLIKKWSICMFDCSSNQIYSRKTVFSALWMGNFHLDIHLLLELTHLFDTKKLIFFLKWFQKWKF